MSIESQLHALNALGQMKRADLSASDDQPLQRLADVLLAIQGEDGSWPGLIDPVRGQPTAFYPVLTVSQIATAPISMRICQEVGLDYVSCSPYRVPIARLAAAQAALRQKS